MISFVGKTVPYIQHTPGKKIGVKVVWKNFKFVGKYRNMEFPIYDWNNLTDCKYVYALPTNTYFNEWYKKPYVYQDDVNARNMTLRFWGKYKGGMTIYGKIIDNIFYESHIRRTIKKD